MKFKRLLVALGAGIALAPPAADELTRVIGYNVLIGFNRAERIEETANWLRSRKPDVILFQEIARQSSESFARQAKLWDHSYAAVCKPWQDYSIGMTSKRPFEMLEMRIDGLHHGYILARIDGVYYMSIHLSPFRYAVRIRETEIYAKRLKPLLAAGEKVIMMGDFNNPSPYDAARANSNAAALEARRYETRPHIENLRNGFFDFQCMDNLLEAGLEDVCFFWMKKHNYRPDVGVRIDMAMLSRNLEDQVVEAYVDTTRREFFQTLSDHYPVILTLKNLHIRNDEVK